MQRSAILDRFLSSTIPPQDLCIKIVLCFLTSLLIDRAFQVVSLLPLVVARYLEDLVGKVFFNRPNLNRSPLISEPLLLVLVLAEL